MKYSIARNSVGFFLLFCVLGQPEIISRQWSGLGIACSTNCLSEIAHHGGMPDSGEQDEGSDRSSGQFAE